jgi:type I restriction enzyme R subunit
MPTAKEAQARIKINKLLEESGWRFEDGEDGKANIRLEPGVKFADLGGDFENRPQGFIDFLLLDQDGRALVVVEAKRESIDPLSAKEQARNYARNSGARFVILSNGNIHYFWDTKHGNPDVITRFPAQESLSQYEEFAPDPVALASTPVDENYIIASQMPGFDRDPSFIDEATRPQFLKNHNLKQLRPYQLKAIRALQASATDGNLRYLFEMATGTGKTLISAAVIKLFLKSGNARRILFLVDRIELEDQAHRAFEQYFGGDYNCVKYKEARDSWQNAHVVVCTIQTLLAGNRFKKEFSPTDFELVISDEAHRSIGGNSRAVFEFFVGYKLGLTATPKDYLKGFKPEETGSDTQREYERRVLLSTYETFGCSSGEPTYRYDLVAGVKDGYLINPVIVDARTDVTTELLSENGYAFHGTDEGGGELEETFTGRDYERKFFNEATNVAMCKAFLDNGLFDPAAAEVGVPLFGKSIVFCVSQSHAARVANILNRMASRRWPGLYSGSDFAMQVTSQVTGAQQMTVNYANNRLGGLVDQPEGYDSSRARVAVTVGMMTTGYDCPDLLNIALMRPVFSPADFVQIKGRGTRKHLFELPEPSGHDTVAIAKDKFKFFDFFATCEYFEHEFQYDDTIKLPKLKREEAGQKGVAGESVQGEFVDEEGNRVFSGPVDLAVPDDVAAVSETAVGAEGMRIDREGFKRAVQEDVLANVDLSALWRNGDVEAAEDYAKRHVLDKPRHFLTLDKIKRAFGLDRRISVREFLEVAFGEKNGFESKDELLESEWEKFVEIYGMDQEHYGPAKNFFKAYIADPEVRDIMTTRQYGKFEFCPSFDRSDFNKLNGYRDKVPQYVRDYAYHLTNL